MSIVAALMQDPNLSPAFRAALAEQTHTARVIITEHIRPPVPSKQYDWRATFDGYDAGDPMGHGPDEASAIADLLVTSEYEGPVTIRSSLKPTLHDILCNAIDEAIAAGYHINEWRDYTVTIEKLHDALSNAEKGEHPTWEELRGETE